MECKLDFFELIGSEALVTISDMAPGKVLAKQIVNMDGFQNGSTIWKGASQERRDRKQKQKKNKNTRKRKTSDHGESVRPRQQPRYDVQLMADLGIGVIQAPPSAPFRARAVNVESGSGSSSGSDSENNIDIDLEHDQILDAFEEDDEDDAGDDDGNAHIDDDDKDVAEPASIDDLFEELAVDELELDEAHLAVAELGTDGPEEELAEAPRAARHDDGGLADIADRADMPFLRGPRVAETRFILDGHLGEIRYNHQGDFFRAHCPVHADCSRRRAGFHSDRYPGQGRPLGMLTHWLQAATSYESKQSHMSARVGSHADRLAARTYLRTMPHSDEFFRHERRMRPTEGPEPDKLP